MARASNGRILTAPDDEMTLRTEESISDDPRRPFAIIEPIRSSRLKLELAELWSYRELLFFLAQRDIKVRYKQTALGALWAILQPILAMLVFTLLFGRLQGVRAGDLPYPLFAYCGLVLWLFFSNAVTSSVNSLIGNTNLLTKVYFPRLIIPAATVLAGTLDFLISSALIVPLALWYGVKFSSVAVFAPLLVLLTMLSALAVGLWMSALTVTYRDVRYVVPFATQLLMFVSSVIVPATVIPERFRWILFLNPLSGAIENFRAVLFGTAINWLSLVASVMITIVTFICAVLYFQHKEQSFADII